MLLAINRALLEYCFCCCGCSVWSFVYPKLDAAGDVKALLVGSTMSAVSFRKIFILARFSILAMVILINPVNVLLGTIWFDSADVKVDEEGV